MTTDSASPILLHVITGLGRGGAEGALAQLVMRSRAYRHLVVSLTDGGCWAAPLRSAGIEVIELGMRRGSASLVAPLRLARLIRSRRPALVQTWLYHADLLGLAAVALSGIACPVLWTLRCSNMDLGLYGRSTRWVAGLLPRLSSRPTAVIANSEAGRVWHETRGYHPRRWEVIPNGIDTEVFRPDEADRAAWRERLGLGPDTLLIGMAARRDPMKDHAGFLRAAALVAEGEGDIAFVLAGKGVTADDPELAELAAGVAAPVHLIGECAAMPSLMAALDIAVMASRFGEGFPTVIGEAMACGVPCVAADVGDAAAIIATTGSVVPVGDWRAMAGSIAALVADPVRRARQGTEARHRIVSCYGLDRAVERYEMVWRDLVTPPLSVALVIPAMGAGGAERVMAGLANDLVRRGETPTLITLEPEGTPSFYPLDAGVRRCWLDALGARGRLDRLRRVIGRFTALRRAVRAVRPDIVLSFLDTMNMTTLLALIGTGVPVVVSERIDPRAHGHRLGLPRRVLRALSYPLAKRVVVQTERIKAGFGPVIRARTTVIANAIVPQNRRAAPAGSGEDGRHILIGVGRLDPQKGFDRAIAAFAAVADRFPDWDLEIWGEGALRSDLEAMAAAAGLTGRVRLPGLTPRIADVLCRAQTMVFPSHYEGFPNALGEAMACGLPAIAFSGVSGVDELIVSGQSGLLVAPEEGTDGLAAALARLMADATLRTAMGEAAAARAALWSSEDIHSRWHDLLVRQGRR